MRADGAAAGGGQDRRPGRPGQRPGRVLAGVQRGARRRRAALSGALLVHPRSGVPADHQPLPGGPAGVPGGVGGRGVRGATTSTTSPTSPGRRAGSPRCTRRPAASPSSSPRWHANMAYGGDQEMVASLRTRGGEVWGSLGLYREPDRPLFDESELSFVRAVAPVLADGARRAPADRRGRATPRARTHPACVVLTASMATRVGDTRRRAVAAGAARRRLGPRPAAAVGAGGRRSGDGDAGSDGPRRPERGRRRAGAHPVRHLGRAARRSAGRGRLRRGWR